MNHPSQLFMIGGREGYSPKIGLLVSQLTNSRHYLLNASRDLTPAQLDAPPLGASNTIGMLLAHLCAAETMFQCITFEGRRFNEAEQAEWGESFALKPNPKSQGRLLEAYLADLQRIRGRTLEQLQGRADEWLETPTTFFKQPANFHYYWFHYLQDEVRHTGQIILLRKHLIEGAEPNFNPYALAS